MLYEKADRGQCFDFRLACYVCECVYAFENAQGIHRG